MDYLIIDNENMALVDPVECGDVQAVQREILAKIKSGRNPRVFIEVPFDISVKVKEDKIGETDKVKARQRKGAGAESEGPVRGGDLEPVSELGEGSGDNQSSNSMSG